MQKDAMSHLILLLLIPAVMGGLAHLLLNASITKKEYLLLVGIGSTAAVGGFFLARWGALQDTELWNGRITEKLHGSEGCCHCRQVCATCTDSKGQSYSCRCHTVCDHSHDLYWALAVNTGDRLTIESCEPPWASAPNAWTNAYVGEPAAVPHGYTNYLLADPDSLLRQEGGADGERAAGVPPYPNGYGFYKVNRFVQFAGAPTNPEVAAKWRAALDELNADLGAKLQVNIVALATTTNDWTVAKAVEAAWIYGKKNDLIFVLGVPDGKTIAWAEVVTISRVEALRLATREKLRGLPIDAVRTLDGVLRGLVADHWHRTPMSEFEYLASAASPSGPWLVALYSLVLLLTAGLIAWGHHEDVFQERYR